MSIKIRKALKLQYPEKSCVNLKQNCMQLFKVYKNKIYTNLNSLDHVSPKISHDSIFHGRKSRPYRSGDLFLHNMDLDLGIWVWNKVLADYSLEFVQTFLFFEGGAAGNSATQRISKMFTLMLLQKYAPLQIFQQQNTIKTRPPFCWPELAEWPPTVLLCTTTGFKKRHLLRCNNVEVGSQVLDVSNLSKTWYKHPVLSRVPWKNCQAAFRWNKNNQQETCVFLMIMFHVYCNYNNNEDYVFFLGPNWYWFSSLDKSFSFRCFRWIKIHTENPCGFTCIISLNFSIKDGLSPSLRTSSSKHERISISISSLLISKCQCLQEVPNLKLSRQFPSPKPTKKGNNKKQAHTETTENIPRDPLLFEIHLITSAKEVSKAQA